MNFKQEFLKNPVTGNVLKFLLFLGIGIALIYLIVRNITPEEWRNIRAAAANANYFWIGVSFITGIVLSNIIRAMRWRMLIESVDKKPGLANTFYSIMAGYMINYALPRLGEISRCGILSKYEQLSFAELIGTVIAERVIDTIMLILFFIAMLLLNFTRVYSIIRTKAEMVLTTKLHAVENVNFYLVAGILIILSVLAILIAKKKNSLLALTKKFGYKFLAGIKSVKKLRQPALFWLYSLLIMLLYLLGGYFSFSCLTETSHLTLSDALVLLVFSALAAIATPGGVGAYQWLIINVLTHIYFISPTIAFTFAWLTWGSQLISFLFLGLASLLLLPVTNKKR